jgi:metallo-beta-lactamase class B
VKDGQALSVGDASLVARMTPGHTQGTTTWLTTVKDAGKELRVVFPASTTVNPGVRIEGNPRYPTMLADFERTFSVLETLPCDVFLGQHAGFFGLAEKRAKLVAGTPNPFVDPEGCRQAIAGMEARFRKELADQRAAR